VNKQQLLLLLLSKLTIYAVGLGLTSVLPVYATKLGGSPQFIGFYLSSALLCLCFGTMLAGWLSNRWQKYKPLLCWAAAAYAPALVLMSQARDIWQLAVFTDIVWFLGGMGMSLVNIMVGLSSGEGDRGKAFSLLELSQGFGGLIGGLTVGPLADGLGYPRMILVVAGFSLLWLAAALFVQEPDVRDQKIPSPSVDISPTTEFASNPFNLAFYSLLLSSAIATSIQYIDALTRPLLMDSLGFDATSISRIATTLVITLPWLPLIGWLCDRIWKRHWLLMGCYAIGAIGMLGTIFAKELWQFWWTAGMINLVPPSLFTIGSTWITERIPHRSLGIALSLFNLTLWFPGVFGLPTAGYLIGQFGKTQTFAIAAVLPVIACLFLLPLMQPENSVKPS
jgi:MFS family permease